LRLSGELEAVALEATPSPSSDACPLCGGWRGPTWFWLQCEGQTRYGRRCEPGAAFCTTVGGGVSMTSGRLIVADGAVYCWQHQP
jgi:hypothetical protein